MTNTKLKRNNGFDFLKLVCAFLIICIHTEYSAVEYVKPAARIAVPIFFMITGYFYASVCKAGRQTAQIRKIFTISVVANLIYFFWSVLTGLGSLAETVEGWLDMKLWLRFLLLNESPFRSHLWYLGAVLYVLLLMLALEKLRVPARRLYPLIPVLLGVNLALGNYSLLLFKTNIDLVYSRNFLFIGLPCFLLGDLIHSGRFTRVSNPRLWLMFICSILLTQVERILLTHSRILGNADFFIGTIFAAYAAFLLVRNNPHWFQSKGALAIAWMGRELSLGLYILNTIVRTIVSKGIGIIGAKVPVIETLCFHTMPLVMLIATSSLVFLLGFLGRKLRKSNH